MSLLFAAALLIVVACAACVAVASRRHKRGARGDVNPVGRTGMIERDLRPEGAVIVAGELWPARSRSGRNLTRAQSPRVRVVGVGRHWLEVEPEE
jgi:membrane protein implicated in regulation of membrane protease activity